MSIETYLKKHSEALVKEVGIEAACALTGKSKATLGRYYSDADEHGDRFMPIDVVAQLEAASGFPHVTSALADLRGITLAYDADRANAPAHDVNHDVVALAQRFAMLMSEYNLAIGDGAFARRVPQRILIAHGAAVLPADTQGGEAVRHFDVGTDEADGIRVRRSGRGRRCGPAKSENIGNRVGGAASAWIKRRRAAATARKSQRHQTCRCHLH